MIQHLVRGVALVLVVSAAATAQTISGTVVDSATRAPLPGVVVTQFATDGSVIQRITTGRAGFSMVLSPQAARVQFRRIGFIPVEIPPAAAAAGPLEVRMRRAPAQLQPVVTTSSPLCDEDATRGQALAVWDQVRSGLLASAIARETQKPTLSLLSYQYDQTESNKQPMHVERKTGSATRAFGVAYPPIQLATSGYVMRDSGSALFIAPDEVVLADDTFLETHCMSLPKAGRRDSLIVIAFEPLRNRRTPDVEGTVTLRRNPMDLLAIDYRYTGLTGVEMRFRPGGEIVFSLMPTGVSMVSEWNIRAVWADLGRTDLASVGSRRSGGGTYSITRVTGGVIERIEWTGLTPWVATLPSLAGRVKRVDPDAVLVARLTATPYVSAVDSAGQFHFSNVVPGLYSLSVDDTVLTAVGVRNRYSTVVEVKNGASAIEVDVRRRRDAIADACREETANSPILSSRGGKGAIFGRFESPAGTGVRVPFTAFVEGTSDSVSGMTSAAGTFRLCKLAVPSTVTIRSAGAAGVVEHTVHVRPDSLIHFSRLLLGARPPAARREVRLAPKPPGH